MPLTKFSATNKEWEIDCKLPSFDLFYIGPSYTIEGGRKSHYYFSPLRLPHSTPKPARTSEATFIIQINNQMTSANPTVTQ